MIVTPECDKEKWEVCPSTIIANADHYYTKPQVDSLIAEMSGATPEQVEEMIDESLEDYYDKNAINDILATKADSSALTEEIQRAQNAEGALASQISTKANASALTQETQRAEQAEAALSNEIATKANAVDVYTKVETDSLLDAKLDASAYTPTDLSNYYTKSETSGSTEISNALSNKQDTLISGTNIKTINNESILGSGNIIIQGGGGGISSAECQTMIDNSISGKADSSAVTQEISAAVSGKADTSAVTETISAAVSGKADSSAVTQEISAAVSGKVDTSAITSSVTSSSTNAEIPTAKAVYDAIGDGGISSAECQTMIDNSISGKADSSSVYTKTEVDSALSGKASTATTQTLSNTLGTHTADTTIHVTSQEKTTWNNKSDFSGNYNDLSNKPTIPNYSAGSGITITNNTISAKIWSGTRTEWGQISGNTQADMIYFVYES